MEVIERFAGLLVLAFLRYLPPVVLPGLTPLSWAPPMVRIVLAIGLAWLTVLALPLDMPTPGQHGAIGWLVAGMSELTIGLVFGLVLMIPQAALHVSGWMIDMQAGLSAATLFNPGMQGDVQSPLGTGLMLLGTALFFAMDLHLDLYRALVASTQLLPVGHGGVHLDLSAFLGLIGSSFVLGLMVAAPVMLGMFAVDISVAYASRSMPQANVYFLMLPLKIIVAVLLLVATLPFVPSLLRRMYGDAFARLPELLGG
jgi:flagellar biosynthetic protein FliR